MTATNILILFVCPAIGLVLANFMWLSSLPLVLLLRYVKRSLDDVKGIDVVNCYPFLFMVLNCLSWVIYSYFINDLFVYFSNLFGFLLGCFYCFSCLGVFHSLGTSGQRTPEQRQAGPNCQFESEKSNVLSSESDPSFKENDDLSSSNSGDMIYYYLVERLLLIIFGFWFIIGLTISILLKKDNSFDLVTQMIGLITLIFTVSYYASPLTMMITIIKKKDASSLYPPMIIVNCMNASMWFLYGLFGRNDQNIWIPNGIGVVLALLQLLLICLYPSKEEKEQFFSYVEILQLLSGYLPEGRKKTESSLESSILELNDI
eukprot:gene5213-5589_t